MLVGINGGVEGDVGAGGRVPQCDETVDITICQRRIIYVAYCLAEGDSDIAADGYRRSAVMRAESHSRR